MNEISVIAHGKWEGVLLACGFDENIFNRRNQPCPLCGGKDRFRWVNKLGNGYWVCNQCNPEGSDGIDFIMRRDFIDFKSAARIVREVLGENMIQEVKVEDKIAENLARIKRIWGGTKEITKGDAVTRYLEGRGLRWDNIDRSMIRIHEGIDYYDVEGDKPIKKGKFPCMVARVLTAAPEQKGSTLHITYIDPETFSKAPVSSPKKVLPTVRSYAGGGIQVTPVTSRMSVSEGIENGLKFVGNKGVHSLFVSMNADNLELFVPPNEVEFLTIIGDSDLSYKGQRSAFTLANKIYIKGKVIISGVEIPCNLGSDFADQG